MLLYQLHFYPTILHSLMNKNMLYDLMGTTEERPLQELNNIKAQCSS